MPLNRLRPPYTNVKFLFTSVPGTSVKIQYLQPLYRTFLRKYNLFKSHSWVLGKVKKKFLVFKVRKENSSFPLCPRKRGHIFHLFLDKRRQGMDIMSERYTSSKLNRMQHSDVSTLSPKPFRLSNKRKIVLLLLERD